MKHIEPISIYMIDDDEMFLKALQHRLQVALKDCVKIKSFLTGEAFLKNIESEKPDIIILDHILNSKLPYAMDGMYVLQKIKQLHPEIPVIIVSGQNKIEVALTSIKNGAYEYVIKNDNAFLKIQNVIKNIIKSSRILSKRRFLKGLTGITLSMLLIVFITLVILKLFYS